MSTANLQAEVQSRIDALTYPIDVFDLLQNAIDTVGLGLDLTNIKSVLEQATTVISNLTSDDEITALNTASIALGVTSSGGGAGGAYPQFSNEQVYLSSDTFIVPDGVNVVYVTLMSGGGGGGGGQTSSAVAQGGIGGSYIELVPIKVNAGDIIPISVGSGGFGSTGNGGNGGASSFGALQLTGGNGGRGSNTGGINSFATGLNAPSGLDVKFGGISDKGTAGGRVRILSYDIVALATNPQTLTIGFSGGAQGASGDAGNGGGGGGASALADGGDGGVGQQNANGAPDLPPNSYGAGGGGAGAGNDFNSFSGADGGDGLVIINW